MSSTRPHFNILDGLRGVAALMVVWYHIFEGFAFAEGSSIGFFNHGYLAVDLFFMLSGFVISYSYDDRMGKELTIGKFIKRRLVRLHPMVIMGAVVGMIAFLIQGGIKWDGSGNSAGWIVTAFVAALFLFPAWPGAKYDIRGNGEMFPLNGPCWSLFFEYIGSFLYALFIWRLPKRFLTLFCAAMGLILYWFALTDQSGYGMIGVGWTLDGANFFGGLIRMLFPFTLGMVLSRNFRPTKVKGVFWIAALLLFILFSVPFIESRGGIPFNSIYELAIISIAFPLIVWFGASDTITSRLSLSICKFLGDISYPLYITHYPVMYLFYSWLIEKRLYTLSETWPAVILAIALSITIGYLSMRFYETPVRRWLSGKIR